MRFLTPLQQKIGFTRQEAIAILALSATFLLGLGIRWFQSHDKNTDARTPQFDYSGSDSVYAAAALRHSRDSLASQPKADSSLKQSRVETTTSPKVKSSSSPININRATKNELMSIPGIGPSFADRIIAYRESNGTFSDVDELTRVKGIGKKKLEKLRVFVVAK